jgi:hypothetical protein
MPQLLQTVCLLVAPVGSGSFPFERGLRLQFVFLHERTSDVLFYQANKNYISAPFMNISVNIIIISNALTFKVFTPVESTVQVAVMILPFTNMT